MKVDYYLSPATPLSYVEAEAFRAAALGYDGFFAAETAHEPFMPLVLAARAAPELMTGTAIALAFPRSPMTTAHIAWDLAAFTHGKFLLGLGTQVKAHITRRFSGEWLPPGPRMRDYLGALRAIFKTWQMGADLRAGFSHLIAALAAEGTSTVYGVNLINRGYEDFEAKLAGLGAHAERP